MTTSQSEIHNLGADDVVFMTVEDMFVFKTNGNRQINWSADPLSFPYD